jgi:hypothetical protein
LATAEADALLQHRWLVPAMAFDRAPAINPLETVELRYSLPQTRHSRSNIKTHTRYSTTSLKRSFSSLCKLRIRVF